VVQPDLLFVSAARAEICRDFVDGAPDLVIEVLSSAHPERDRIVKRDLYERDGVPEYWLVDRADRSIEVLRLEGGTYGPAGWFTGAEALASRTFEGLVIPLSHVFGSAAS
jgi:Uma2 family endonuclease